MPAEYGLKELCENDFFKNFYMYCKKLFHYCCGIEKDFFFPNYSGKLDNIKKDDIHHDNLTKDFFIKEINNHFSFDKELTIREDNDVDKNVIKVKLYDLLIGIEIMLPKLNAYIKYTEYKKSYEKQDLQSRISLEMDLLLFEPTNEHDNNTKKETGIELPAYSFSKEQRKILRKLGCLKLYDAIELLRELKNFTETPDYEEFFKNFIHNLYENYNIRKASNKNEMRHRNYVKGKLTKAIDKLPLSDEDKYECKSYIHNGNIKQAQNFLKEKNEYNGDIHSLFSELQYGYTKSLDQPKDKKEDENALVSRIRTLLDTYIDCFTYENEKNIKKFNLNKESLEDTYKKAIKLIFSGNYDLLKKEDRDKFVEDFQKKYENPKENEVPFILHKLNNKNKNFLYGEYSILDLFRKSITNKIADLEKEPNNVKKLDILKELKELEEYITSMITSIKIGEN